MLRLIVLAVGLFGITWTTMGSAPDFLDLEEGPSDAVLGKIQLYHMMSLTSPPSIEHSLYALRHGLVKGSAGTEGQEKGTLEFINHHLIEVLASILHWYPRANLVMVGRDMWFFADCLESLILQLDLDAKVTRLGVSRSTFGLVDERYHEGRGITKIYNQDFIKEQIQHWKSDVVAMLDSFGINRESVNDRPHVFIDGCNSGREKVLVYAKQPRIIMGALFQHLEESGMDSKDLVKKIQFVGLNNQVPKNELELQYSQRYLAGTEAIWAEQRRNPESVYLGEFARFPYTEAAGSPLYFLGLFLGDHHPWHDKFGKIQCVQGGEIRARPTKDGLLGDKLVHLQLQRFIWDAVAERIDEGIFPELPEGYWTFDLERKEVAAKALFYNEIGKDGSKDIRLEQLESVSRFAQALNDSAASRVAKNAMTRVQVRMRAREEQAKREAAKKAQAEAEALAEICERFAKGNPIDEQEADKLKLMKPEELAMEIASHLKVDGLCQFVVDETRDIDLSEVKKEICQILAQESRLDKANVSNIKALHLHGLFGEQFNGQMALLYQLLVRIQAKTSIDDLLLSDPAGYPKELRKVLPYAILWARDLETFNRYADHIAAATGQPPFMGVDRECTKAFFKSRPVALCKAAIAKAYDYDQSSSPRSNQAFARLFAEAYSWMQTSAAACLEPLQHEDTAPKKFTLKDFLEIPSFARDIRQHKRRGVSWKQLIAMIQTDEDATAFRDLVGIRPDRLRRRPHLWGTERRIKAQLQKLEEQRKAERPGSSAQSTIL